MSDLKLFDENFRQQAASLKSYIELSRSSVAIASFDTQSRQYVGLETLHLDEKENWHSWVEGFSKSIHSLDFGKNSSSASICLVDPLYTLVPLPLFDENAVEQYITFNHPIEHLSEYHIQSDFIENLSLVVVFAVPVALQQLLMKLGPSEQKWHHHSKGLLESASLRTSSGRLFQIHLQKNHFDILLIEDKALKFFNSFPIKNDDDVIYYLLYVMDQLNLEREKDAIELVGEFEKNSSIYELLHQYIRTITMGSRPSGVNFSTILSEVPAQHFHNLFNQHLCE